MNRHSLNEAADLVLELSEGRGCAADICSRLVPHLDQGAETCVQWIPHAIGEKWLQRAEPAARLPQPPEFSAAALQLRNRGEVVAAFVCQEYATALQPESASDWCALGELAHITGRRERAREAYQAYLSFEPGDAEVTQIVRALSDEPPPPRAPNDFVTQLYARYASFYEKNMREELVYQGPVLIAEMLDRFLPEVAELDVLELGCGTGMTGRQLRSRARRLVGVDLSPEMVEIAETSGIYDELVVAEITTWLSTQVAKFDLVLICDTLIYFGDLNQVIIPSTQHLRPGGWIAMTVEKGNQRPFVLTDSGRYCHTEQHLREVAQASGLVVVSIEEEFLRNEYGRAVTGLIALLRRPPGECF